MGIKKMSGQKGKPRPKKNIGFKASDKDEKEKLIKQIKKIDNRGQGIDL